MNRDKNSIINLLILDDEIDLSTILRDDLIDLWGNRLNIETASNYDSAFKLSTSRKFDIIIADNQVGGTVTLENVDDIKNRLGTNHIILFTSVRDLDFMNLAKKKGIICVLQKPYSNDDLQNSIGFVIEEINSNDPKKS